MRLVLPLFLVLVGLFPVASRAQQSWYPIVADDGSPVANNRLPVELTSELDTLAGTVAVGNPRGLATVYEFYDLNCPYCRAAVPDLHALLQQEKELKLVLVPYPVLGIPSIQAGRIELAVAKVTSPEVFYAFHRRIFAERGVIDATKAATVARDLGIDLKKLVDATKGDAVMEIMKTHAALGDQLGLSATPSFVVANASILGYPGKKSLQGVIRAVARCGEVVCRKH